MEETTYAAAEQTTQRIVEVIATVNPDPNIYMMLGFIAALIALVMLGLFLNR